MVEEGLTDHRLEGAPAQRRDGDARAPLLHVDRGHPDLDRAGLEERALEVRQELWVWRDGD